MKRFLLGVAALFVVVSSNMGCVTASTMSFLLSSEGKAYLARAKVQPTEFELPLAETDSAWQRAQVFLAQYVHAPLEMVTDTVIQSRRDLSADAAYAYTYSVSRIFIGGNARFTVKCIPYDTLADRANASMNARLFAYYIQTGEEPPTRDIDVLLDK